MKNINKFICASVVGLALAAFAASASAADKTDAKAKDTYPLKTCVVSGEKLNDMGKPYVFKYKGQEVRLCCKKCLKKFDKDPETYLKKLEAAKAKAKK